MRIITPSDLIEGFQRSDTKRGLNNLGVYVCFTNLSGHDGQETPIWLFFHERSLAPVKRTIGDTLSNIRLGNLLDDEKPPGKLNLNSEVLKLTNGDCSTAFYDFKIEKARLSFGFLMKGECKIAMSAERAPDTLLPILSFLSKSDKEAPRHE